MGTPIRLCHLAFERIIILSSAIIINSDLLIRVYKYHTDFFISWSERIAKNLF